ncbi:MAG TPA: hypothetical protein VFL27_10320 [Candidatus Dormibacteraeota bacterium]|nr:hypothetical protein [Candidatus Dormibacteraeota bacterium]
MLQAFVAFALASQAILFVYFAARRWRPRSAERYGWLAYAFGATGLAVGAAIALGGGSWRLYAGPLLFTAWAAFGAWADLLARTEWRRPVRWSVFGPYVLLYLAAQMFLWWPMWEEWRMGWAVYLVLFVGSTALNLAGHARGATATAG